MESGGQQNIQQESTVNNQIDWGKRRKIFYLILYVNMLTNYDTGVVPVAILNIQHEMHVNNSQIALLGTISNLGISFASIFLAAIYEKYSMIKILAFASAINSILCIFLCFSFQIHLMQLMRFFMGVCQSFWVIYAPIWINTFSPDDSTTLWMGMWQGLAPIGAIVGYFATGVIINIVQWEHAWRIAMILQAIFILPSSVLIYMFNEDEIDVLYEQKKQEQEKLQKKLLQKMSQKTEYHEDEQEDDNNIYLEYVRTYFRQISIILKNKIYVYHVLTLVCTFFLVTAVQFWVTSLIETVFLISPENSMKLYALVIITAPVSGIILGGNLADRLGGYKGENMHTAIKLQLCFYIIATLLAIPTGFATNIALFAVLLWSAVFFGACVVPPCTGLIIACLPLNLQSVGQSFSQVLVNSISYFLSPILCANVIDFFKNDNDGKLYGLKFAVLVYMLGVYFLYKSYIYLPQYLIDNPELLRNNLDDQEEQLENPKLRLLSFNQQMSSGKKASSKRYYSYM